MERTAQAEALCREGPSITPSTSRLWREATTSTSQSRTTTQYAIRWALYIASLCFLAAAHSKFRLDQV